MHNILILLTSKQWTYCASVVLDGNSLLFLLKLPIHVETFT
ncbi:hypothetical protein NA63_1701 [Flavobacteriaceae bacterium MAR_2010_105]|nr:hypothetical protein NA63_1701 [Flavobacteriaceae bacterium MAR_2010_105]